MNLIKPSSIECVPYVKLETSYLNKNHENQFSNIYNNIFDDLKDERWARALDVK